MTTTPAASVHITRVTRPTVHVTNVGQNSCYVVPTDGRKADDLKRKDDLFYKIYDTFQRKKPGLKVDDFRIQLSLRTVTLKDKKLDLSAEMQSSPELKKAVEELESLIFKRIYPPVHPNAQRYAAGQKGFPGAVSKFRASMPNDLNTSMTKAVERFSSKEAPKTEHKNEQKSTLKRLARQHELFTTLKKYAETGKKHVKSRETLKKRLEQIDFLALSLATVTIPKKPKKKEALAIAEQIQNAATEMYNEEYKAVRYDGVRSWMPDMKALEGLRGKEKSIPYNSGFGEEVANLVLSTLPTVDARAAKSEFNRQNQSLPRTDGPTDFAVEAVRGDNKRLIEMLTQGLNPDVVTDIKAKIKKAQNIKDKDLKTDVSLSDAWTHLKTKLK